MENQIHTDSLNYLKRQDELSRERSRSLHTFYSGQQNSTAILSHVNEKRKIKEGGTAFSVKCFSRC